MEEEQMRSEYAEELDREMAREHFLEMQGELEEKPDLCPYCDALLPERDGSGQVICEVCNRAVIDRDLENDYHNPEI
jgi:hypothetical protein